MIMDDKSIREIQVEFDQLAWLANEAGVGQEWLSRMGELATRVRTALGGPVAAGTEGKGIRVTGEVYPDRSAFLTAPAFGDETVILGADAGTRAAEQIELAFAERE
jgi:hypothetical protein